MDISQQHSRFVRAEHEELCDSRGGRIPLDRLTSECRLFVEQAFALGDLYLSDFRTAAQPQFRDRAMCFAVVSSAERNAWAIRGVHGDHVLLTSGLISALIATFANAFTCAPFIPFFPLDRPPVVRRLPFDIRISDCQVVQGGKTVPWIVPRILRGRWGFASAACTAAIQFITLHEIGHIIANHGALRSKHHGVVSYDESPISQHAQIAPPNNFEALPIAIREFDADTFAATIYALKCLAPMRQVLTERRKEIGGLDSGIVMQAISGVAVYTLFRVLDPEDTAGCVTTLENYPAPLLRAFCANICIQKCSQKALMKRSWWIPAAISRRFANTSREKIERSVMRDVWLPAHAWFNDELHTTYDVIQQYNDMISGWRSLTMQLEAWDDRLTAIMRTRHSWRPRFRRHDD